METKAHFRLVENPVLLLTFENGVTIFEFVLQFSGNLAALEFAPLLITGSSFVLYQNSCTEIYRFLNALSAQLEDSGLIK